MTSRRILRGVALVVAGALALIVGALAAVSVRFDTSRYSLEPPALELPKLSFRMPAVAMPERSLRMPSLDLPRLPLQLSDLSVPELSFRMPPVAMPELSFSVPDLALPEIPPPWAYEGSGAEASRERASPLTVPTVTVTEAAEEGARPGPGSAVGTEIDSTLVIGTKRTSDRRRGTAAWMTLVALNHDAGKGAVLSLPAHTAAEVPGHGLLPLSSAFDSGGAPLLSVTVANLLGVEVDNYVELSKRGAEDLFRATGTLTVNVPSEVEASGSRSASRPLFYAGEQSLTPSWQAELMYLQPGSVDDVTLGPLQLAQWDALLDRFRTEPTGLERAVSGAAKALRASDASAADHGRLLGELSALPEIGITLASVPVSDLGVSGGELYGPNRLEIDLLLERSLDFQAPEEDEVAVQILNGNGVPGIGEAVAEALVGQGYSVVLSGNAQRLDYRRTLIVSHIDSPAGELAAREAKRLLGAGRVQISSQGHGIVDLTIVVGKDFLRER